MPIKANRSYWGGRLPSWISAADDPRALIGTSPMNRTAFSNCVSSIWTGRTWKTTRPTRHILSNEVMDGIVRSTPDAAILDVGASDGSTSLDLIEKLGGAFGRFIVTDLLFKIYAVERNGITYFYHPQTRRCVLRTSNRFLVYANSESPILPIRWICDSLLAKAPELPGTPREVSVCQPDLRRLAANDSRVVIREWDLFTPWAQAPVDVIKVSNVLNRSYFTSDELRVAIRNLNGALKQNGHVVIIDNRDTERWSVFAREGSGFRRVSEGNGGCETSALFDRPPGADPLEPSNASLSHSAG